MYSQLLSLLPNGTVKFNELMKNHTTFKIGGPADVMVIPGSLKDIVSTISFCDINRIPFFVLGLGSNLLVRDKGFRGVAIKLGKALAGVSVQENIIEAEAGVRLSQLSRIAAQNSLSGLEFAEGIPGSLGGAVVMNAGAFDGEMKDVVIQVTALDYQGRLHQFSPSDMMMGYRSSIFQDSSYIVVSAMLELKPGLQEEIYTKMREFSHRRQEKQPLDLPSAGSTFKRPSGFYVGPMLEELGLKGYQIGGAQVSLKHAGFIVNTGNATATDVINLIQYIQKRVKERFGADLQPELKIIGQE